MKTIDQLLEATEGTIEDLAVRAGMALERVTAIVEGRWTPNPEERERLAAAFGVSVDSVGWGHTMNPRNVRYRRFGLRENF